MKKNTWVIMIFVSLFPILVKAEMVTVSSYEELKDAINGLNTDIFIDENITFDSAISVTYDVKISGNRKITRAVDYKGSLFTITSGSSLKLKDLTIDGGASGWSMDYDNRYYTQAGNKGYVRVPTIKNSEDIVATASIISNSGSLIVNNITIQNAACSVTGCAISGKGNNTINNSVIKHVGASKSGGAIGITGGKTVITDSIFNENVSGYGVETSMNGGAMNATGTASVEIINTKFEENFAQGNGGALYLSKTNIKIINCIFSHNSVGNDGSALDLENNTTAIYTISIEDSIFEKNIGLATTGQSMGTVWIGSKLNNTVDNPVLFKNLIFRENIARTGGAMADNSKNTYVKFENIEVYENEIGAGGFIYAQTVNYDIDGLNVHDNNSTNGSAIYVYGANVKVDNATIANNNSTNSGTGIYLAAGTLKISNSEISGNKSAEGRGAGIYVRGSYDDYVPVLVLENTVIKNNEAATDGGGIFVRDNENIFSSITIDNGSKIYDNKAQNSGDDFVYFRENGSDNTSNNSITLDNISIAGISGIDGWYHDNEGDRFLDTANPTVFGNYEHYTGSGIYLKAAGISSVDYDLNGGNNTDIVPIEIRYGQDYQVTDEIPQKEGYIFLGWNTKEDGSGISLSGGEKYDGRDGYVLFAQYKTAEIINDDSQNYLIVKTEAEVENPETTDSIVGVLLVFIISFIVVLFLGFNSKRSY